MHDLTSTDPAGILAALTGDLSPGLLIAVVGDDGVPSSAQTELLASLSCLALAGTVRVGSSLLAHINLSSSPRPGSLVCVSRSANGLEAELLASTSIRTKSHSARRLLVRRQLSAPLPFDLERRRTAALRRLLASGNDIDLPTALQLLDEESQRANDLGNRVKELETLLEWAYEEQDAALGNLDDAQAQLRYLQKAFRELGQVAAIEPEEDASWLPESSLEALAAARELLPFLVIGPTGDHCEALDAHQKRSIWAKKIWATLRALNDYCRTKSEGRFSGDLTAYRDNAPDGVVPLLAEYAPSESKSTTDDSALAAIRTFPVPQSVAESGKVYMKQHVKIDKGGQSAPRIHLHDDSGGVTQRVYIGYIGPHLPTAGGF